MPSPRQDWCVRCFRRFGRRYDGEEPLLRCECGYCKRCCDCDMGEVSETERRRQKLLNGPTFVTPPRWRYESTLRTGREPDGDLDELLNADERLSKYLRWKAKVKFYTPEKTEKKVKRQNRRNRRGSNRRVR